MSFKFNSTKLLIFFLNHYCLRFVSNLFYSCYSSVHFANMVRMHISIIPTRAEDAMRWGDLAEIKIVSPPFWTTKKLVGCSCVLRREPLRLSQQKDLLLIWCDMYVWCCTTCGPVLFSSVLFDFTCTNKKKNEIKTKKAKPPNIKVLEFNQEPWGTNRFSFHWIPTKGFEQSCEINVWIYQSRCLTLSVRRGNCRKHRITFCSLSLQAQGASHSHWAAPGSGGDHHTAGVGHDMEGFVCGKQAK